MDFIENRTFDEINVGDTATLERTLTEQDIAKYAANAEDAAKPQEALKPGKKIVIVSPQELEKMKAGQAGTIQWTIIAVLVGIGIALAFMD